MEYYIVENSLLALIAKKVMKSKNIALVLGKGIHLSGVTREEFLKNSRWTGLCQPTYILDIPGGYGKADIGQNSIRRDAEGCYSVSDYNGQEHIYPPRGS